MQWVAVTQWVRPARGTSHLTTAQPAGQECTPRTPPVMGVRSWRERGSRPRDGAPQDGTSWATGSSSRCREGKADGVQWPAGRRPGCAKARGQDTTGVCARGLLAQGCRGNVGEPRVSVGPIRRRRADRRGADSRRGEEASAAHTSLAQSRDTKSEACPKVSGQEREHRPPPRGAMGRRSGAESRRPGAGAPGRAGGEPRPTGPPGGQATPGITFSGRTSGRDAGLTPRLPAPPEHRATGQALSGDGVPHRVSLA